MHNETDHQEMKQISTALLETRVSRADPESSCWSAASSKTGPSRGHLFSPDPEACRRDGPLREHKESQSICSPPCHLGRGSVIGGWSWHISCSQQCQVGEDITTALPSPLQSIPALCCAVTPPSSAHCCSKFVDIGAHKAQSEECFCSYGICVNRGCAAGQRCGK